jgi:hypothetical protein
MKTTWGFEKVCLLLPFFFVCSWYNADANIKEPVTAKKPAWGFEKVPLKKKKRLTCPAVIYMRRTVNVLFCAASMK